MTRIDRYILRMYLRTLVICFCSLAGIFVIFHAFNNLDELSAYGDQVGGMERALLDYYGPYLLLIFESTGAMLALLSLLFTIGWLRRSGELTALLAAGIHHGRILRPMLLAAGLLIVVGLINREWLLPHFREQLGSKPQDLAGETQRALLPCYDRQTGILVEGKGLILVRREIVSPAFRLLGDYPDYGERVSAATATWMPARGDRPAGYLLRGVTAPSEWGHIPSAAAHGRTVLYSPVDTDWLQPDQCFVATAVDFDLLQAGGASRQYASLGQLIRRVRNPAVHTSGDVQVLLHSRFLRPALDFSLVLLGLPLAVSRSEKNLFVVVGHALWLVALFFGVKTAATTMGASGYLLSPAMAAWAPVLILAPIAYTRYCGVQNQ